MPSVGIQKEKERERERERESFGFVYIPLIDVDVAFSYFLDVFNEELLHFRPLLHFLSVPLVYCEATSL